MFAIARVIGSGTMDDPFRPDATGRWRGFCAIPVHLTGVDRGKPKFSWCVIKVPDASTGTDLFKLPDIPFDTVLGDLSIARRQALKNKLDSLGVDTSLLNASMTFKQAIKTIIIHLRPDFRDEDIKE